MQEFVIKKEFVSLIEDGTYQDQFNLEETFFLPAGIEGVIIDEGTINLIPNLSEKQYSDIVSWFLLSKKRDTYLVLVQARLIELPMDMFEHVGYHPPAPTFEDEEDAKAWLGERIKKMTGEKEDASA